MRVISWALVVVAMVGCSAAVTPDTPVITPVRVIEEPAPVAEPSLVVAEIPFTTTELPTGVAVEPGTGRRMLLTREGTVLDLGTGAVLWRAVAPQEPFGFTDLVALGEGRLAVTSVSNGFLVELATGSMSMHFCYEPGWFEEMPNDPVQVSQGLARDPLGGLLYAQPRTIENGGFGAVTGSFVAAYDEEGGADLAWWQLPDPSFVATGMIALPSESRAVPDLLLAVGTELHRFDPETAELRRALDLSELGIGDIAGLALDEAAGTVLVVDGPRSRVVELRASALEPR